MLLRLFALCLLLVHAPLLAGWNQADSTHFRVFGGVSAEGLAERAALLEDFHGLLVNLTGFQLPENAPKLDIFLVDRIASASPWRKLPANVAGIYRADSGRISIVALDRGLATEADLGGQEILLHEYAHHFLMGTGGLSYPAWYVEGFAEYFATTRTLPDRIEFGRISANRAAWLRKGEWIALEKLLVRGGCCADEHNSAMFYAQSWLLTHYMLRAPGMRSRLISYLKATSAGEDPVMAFRTYIDPDFSGFQQKLRRYLESGATFSTIDRTSGRRAISIRALPDGADQKLLYLVALEHGVPPESREKALQQVRKLAARHPKSQISDYALALAELQLGSKANAVKMLDRLLEDNPNNPNLLRWRGAVAGAEGNIAQAKKLLRRAIEANPSDWRSIYAWARLHHPENGQFPPDALEALLQAYHLAPQVSELGLDTALALAYSGRLPEAAKVLEPIAWAPHRGPATDAARRLLARAMEQDRAAYLAEAAALRRENAAAASSALKLRFTPQAR